jgi:hypothetical protein
MESRAVTADERAELEGLIGTGERLGRIEYEVEGDVIRLIIEIEPRRLAPIVGPDQATPEVPPHEPERVTGEGRTADEAFAEAKAKVRDRPHRAGPARQRP